MGHFMYFNASCAAPESLDPISIVSVTSYSALAVWDPPASPNGLILGYTIIVLDTSDNEFLTVDTTATEANVTGLYPFTTYVFRVRACNSAGCVTSADVFETTDEACKPAMVSCSAHTHMYCMHYMLCVYSTLLQNVQVSIRTMMFKRFYLNVKVWFMKCSATRNM